VNASVSVVVLSYSRPHLLRQALAAVFAQTYPRDALEVLVVDNRSAASAEVARIVAEHPEARLIANPENSGFTGGMNLGIREASGDLVYLTEDDILLERENVAELVKYIDSDPRAGIVSGIMHDHESGRIWFAGGRIALGPKFTLETPGRDEVDRGTFTAPFRVTYLSGATMLARRELWAKLGGFREEFFMYQEDVELGLRVLATGRDLVIVPSARSRHFHPKAGPQSALIAFHAWKNLFAVYALHAPPNVLPEFFLRSGLRTLRHSVSDGGPPLRAWGYLARRLPLLLRERKRIVGAAPTC